MDGEIVRKDLVLLAILALQVIHSESQEGKQSGGLTEKRKGDGV